MVVHQRSITGRVVTEGHWIAPEDLPGYLASRPPEPEAPTQEAPAPSRQLALPPPPRPSRRRLRAAVAAAVVAGLLLAPTAAAEPSSVAARQLTLIVDGQPVNLTTQAATVADALHVAGLPIGDHDIIAPAPTAAVRSGSVITVQRGRQVTVTIDGRTRTVWTTSTKLDELLGELGLDAANYQVANRSRAIPATGLEVTGQRLRDITLTDGPSAPVSLRTGAATVGDLLAERSITLRDDDTVTPGATTPLADHLAVTVTRKRITERAYTETIPEPPAQTVANSDLGKGNSTLTQPGRSGSKDVIERTVVLNGITETTLIKQTITLAAQPQITSVGTKETGLPESWSRNWDQMAYCESTNRWNANTGNGTYGGLQFKTPTWLANGGGEFAPRADLATKEQQIIVAERLYAKEGLRPWHCARLLGWGWGK